nr:hypothetical protein GCM10020063_043510 [Dactylosporangium thailandense]
MCVYLGHAREHRAFAFGTVPARGRNERYPFAALVGDRFALHDLDHAIASAADSPSLRQAVDPARRPEVSPPSE